MFNFISAEFDRTTCVKWLLLTVCHYRRSSRRLSRTRTNWINWLVMEIGLKTRSRIWPVLLIRDWTNWNGSGKTWKIRRLIRESDCLMLIVTCCTNRVLMILMAGLRTSNHRLWLKMSVMIWQQSIFLFRNRMFLRWVSCLLSHMYCFLANSYYVCTIS